MKNQQKDGQKLCASPHTQGLLNRTKPRKQGFTLAEVLITLSTIGLLAEITIPILVNNVNQQIYNSSLEIAYSYLSQVIISVISEDGDFDNTTPYAKLDQLCRFLACIRRDTDANIFGANGKNTNIIVVDIKRTGLLAPLSQLQYRKMVILLIFFGILLELVPWAVSALVL